MPLSSNITTYADIERVLPYLLEAGTPFRLQFDSRQAAVTWRQRFYRYRDLLRKQALETTGAIEGYTPSTGLDQYVVGTQLDDGNWVVEVREQVVPRMFGPDGKEITA